MISSLTAANPAPGKQVEQSLDVSDGGKIPYLIYLPENYSSEGEKTSFMLFLHGRGESNGRLTVVTIWGPPRRLAAGGTNEICRRVTSVHQRFSLEK